MQIKKQFTWDRYAKIEVVFFFFVWFILPLLSDLEYTLKEEPTLFRDTWQVAVVRRIVWGCFNVIPYFLFYKLAIQHWLISKHYWQFVLAFAGFIVVLEYYMVYVMYGSISHMHFLPEVIVNNAAKWGHAKALIHFTINYLILQVLEMAALAYYIDYEKQHSKIQDLQRAQLQADMQYLKAQLQPHFFFNTLNNIYSLALQKSDLAAPLITKLSAMMRYVLYEPGGKQPTLQNEISFLENYIDVQSVRYHNKFRINFDIQGVNRDTPMEHLLLFPFIENAFKHGIEEETGSGFIDVIICLAGHELVLSVKNSKARKTENHQKGIGILNTRKRLDLLYPDKYELAITETGDTYFILLTITLPG